MYSISINLSKIGCPKQAWSIHVLKEKVVSPPPNTSIACPRINKNRQQQQKATIH